MIFFVLCLGAWLITVALLVWTKDGVVLIWAVFSTKVEIDS
jgi:hypothetical protein